MYTWKDFFEQEKQKEYYISLKRRVMEEYQKEIVYPPYDLIYNAFKITPFSEVKVVLIGQDPYHNPGQAMGLSFSVPDGFPLPPSLKNIYKEIENEYHIEVNQSGDLTYLAKQGVLLLNSILTVRKNTPLSHQGYGYEILIENILKKLNESDSPIVFLAWGNSAKKLMKYVDNPKHLILYSAHPSPLSAYQRFFGNNHFKLTNELLLKNRLTPIEWIKN